MESSPHHEETIPLTLRQKEIFTRIYIDPDASPNAGRLSESIGYFEDFLRVCREKSGFREAEDELVEKAAYIYRVIPNFNLHVLQDFRDAGLPKIMENLRAHADFAREAKNKPDHLAVFASLCHGLHYPSQRLLSSLKSFYAGEIASAEPAQLHKTILQIMRISPYFAVENIAGILSGAIPQEWQSVHFDTFKSPADRLKAMCEYAEKAEGKAKSGGWEMMDVLGDEKIFKKTEFEYPPYLKTETVIFFLTSAADGIPHHSREEMYVPEEVAGQPGIKIKIEMKLPTNKEISFLYVCGDGGIYKPVYCIISDADKRKFESVQAVEDMGIQRNQTGDYLFPAKSNGTPEDIIPQITFPAEIMAAEFLDNLGKPESDMVFADVNRQRKDSSGFTEKLTRVKAELKRDIMPFISAFVSEMNQDPVPRWSGRYVEDSIDDKLTISKGGCSIDNGAYGTHEHVQILFKHRYQRYADTCILEVGTDFTLPFNMEVQSIFYYDRKTRQFVYAPDYSVLKSFSLPFKAIRTVEQDGRITVVKLAHFADEQIVDANIIRVDENEVNMFLPMLDQDVYFSMASCHPLTIPRRLTTKELGERLHRTDDYSIFGTRKASELKQDFLDLQKRLKGNRYN